MLDRIRQDYRRYTMEHRDTWAGRLMALTSYGFLAMVVYRYGRAARRVRVPVLGQLLRLPYRVGNTLVEMLFGISIDVNSEIGPGFYIGHLSGIIIHGDFGANCSVGQCVSVGSRGAGKSDGWPTLGDNVYIGAGAKVIGHIRVGSNVVIGANAVVIRDVPDNTRAVGVPARHTPLSDGEPAGPA